MRVASYLAAQFLVDRGKDPELLEIQSINRHKVSYFLPQFYDVQGEVRCLLYEVVEGMNILISGSADRTIKLWETKNPKSNPCF